MMGRKMLLYYRCVRAAHRLPRVAAEALYVRWYLWMRRQDWRTY